MICSHTGVPSGLLQRSSAPAEVPEKHVIFRQLSDRRQGLKPVILEMVGVFLLFFFFSFFFSGLELFIKVFQ